MIFGNAIGVSGYGRVIKTTIPFVFNLSILRVITSCQRLTSKSSSYNSLKKVTSREWLDIIEDRVPIADLVMM